MKKVAKAILLALGIIMACGAVLVLIVNIYVQSAATRAQIQDGLSRTLRMPIHVARVDFMPWHGLNLSGVTSRNTDGFDEGNSLEIPSISLHVQFWRLFQHQIYVKDILVDGAKVSWTQAPDGKWWLPEQTETPSSETTPPSTASAPSNQPSETPGSAAPQPSASPAPAPQTPARLSGPQPASLIIKRFRLRDATCNFYDKSHRSLATFSGITVVAPDPSGDVIHGRAVISQVTIQNLFYMEDWSADFKYTADQVSLLGAKAGVGGGVATGDLEVKTAEIGSPFDVDVKFSGVGLDRLLGDAGVTQIQATGQLSGFLRLGGNLRESNSAHGAGRIDLANGMIMKSDLFGSLGRQLHTDKFQQLSLKEAHADYHVADGKVYLDECILKASDITLSGTGTALLADGSLLINSRLTIGANSAREIPDFLMVNFATDQTSGDRYVDFNVTGSVDRPSTNLMDVLGKSMNIKGIERSAGNAIKSWFRGRQAPTPEPTPAALPAAPAPSPTAP